MNWQHQAQQLLAQYWGYSQFRALQLETIACVLNGQDSLTLLPTGGGKSIAFQLPILFQPGKTALVISPLIALMQDQVSQAKQRGLKAEALHSGLPPEERRRIYEAFQAGELSLLYVSPERLAQPSFVEALVQSQRLAYIAVDEAHCISQWGHQFRPEYRQIGLLKQYFPNMGVHAFTATAPPSVEADILQSLQLAQPQVFRGSVFRSNLVFKAFTRPPKAEFEGELLSKVQQLLRQHKGQAGILYCSSRAAVEAWTTTLRNHGINAQGYHAGMGAAERESNMAAFMSGKASVMVATVAFGMGVDRGDIRFVIHLSPPARLESYLQEAGRAGRDGHLSECLLYWTPGDFAFWEKRLKDGIDSPEAKAQFSHQLQQLWAFQQFCESQECRHYQLSEHFSQPLFVKRCHGCDNCGRSPSPLPEASKQVQRLLSAVWRLRETPRLTLVVAALKGDALALPRHLLQGETDVRHWPLYGAFEAWTQADVALLCEQVQTLGLLLLHTDAATQELRATLTYAGACYLKQPDAYPEPLLYQSQASFPTLKRAGESVGISRPKAAKTKAAPRRKTPSSYESRI